MFLAWFLCILAQIYIACANDNERRRLRCGTTIDAIVTIKQGTLQGREAIIPDGIVYYSFKGIPYAKPPLGLLRFKPPEPPESWDEIRNATKHRGKCVQWSTEDNTTIGDEDCLYLNVYTSKNPNESDRKVKPVMFWIHGGSYTSGSGDSEEYGPNYLIKEDIILVTINYRLGALGFLRVDDPDVGIPGNAGLKDMVLALKWVQENIAEFGGDINNVTIFGESAGSAAVHLLTLSPMAKGLFHRAIMESGSAFSMWALMQPGAKPLQELATALGITAKGDKLIIDKIEKLSAYEIVTGQENVKYTFGDPLLFTPTIEKPSNYTAFLADHPLNIIRSGNFSKVPTIIGYNSREGILMIVGGQQFFKMTLQDMVPYNLQLTKGTQEFNEVVEKMGQFYYGGGKPSIENIDKTFTLFTDTYYWVGIYQTIIEQTKASPENIYLYKFSVDSDYNFIKYLLKVNFTGACHGDELGYLFKIEAGSKLPIVPEGLEDLTIKRLTHLWANFAKYGNPNPKIPSDLVKIEWKPVREDEFNFIDIGENLAVGVDPDWNRIQFWKNIYETYSK